MAIGLCLSPRLVFAQRPPGGPLPKIALAADGRAFVTENGTPFVPMGVNYYRPGTGWPPQVWKKFDAEATRQDFARMKALGVNCVRVFLTYGSFCVQPDTLLPEGLAKFDQFLAVAEAARIYVHPTGLDNWEGTPAWATGDRIADERILAATETFWRKFAERYRGRSVIFAYDLRNEPEVPWDTPALRLKWNQWLQKRYASAELAAQAWGVAPQAMRWGEQPPPIAQDAVGDRRLLDYQHFREGLADRWTRRQAAAIKSADPEALVSLGLIQWSVPAMLSSVGQYSGFHPDHLANYLDFLEVHFYPLAGGFYEYGGEESLLRNLAYLESVVREVKSPGKAVVLQEFGWYGGGKLSIDKGRHPAASKEQQSEWCRQVILTSRGLANGWINWGLYDDPAATDVSQLSGLFSSDSQPKAWGLEFQRTAAALAGQAPPPPTLGRRPQLDWDRCITSARAGRQFGDEYYRAFLNERKLRPTQHAALPNYIRPSEILH